ncbi:MAG: hypothetical protein ACI85I_000020 [Arenicella sp.]|jgi:hypothetical protein
MIDKKKVRTIRKVHRFLGVFLGIQFLFWTISGLYFSWTDIDEIHGDDLKNADYKLKAFHNLVGLDSLETEGISKIELREIAEKPYYWINGSQLFNAKSGKLKKGVSEQEAITVAKSQMNKNLKVTDSELITEAGKHHEYRGRPLPAYVISFAHPDEVKAYVSVADGKLQRVRHQSWRWFDFLWMTHTMDYEGRDNINTYLLRAFSILGLITVLSGFTLWGVTTPKFQRKR